jgi:predicted MFS family arabinose efflux permease
MCLPKRWRLSANLLLIAVPFSGDAATAVGLLVVRSLLTQMDIPVRQSYVMATVEPAERPAAASLTTGPKTLATAVGPVLAGAMLAVSPFGWPFVVAGALKIVYDLALLGLFANRPPPEEREN